jgi:hypothetical protein
MLYECQRASLPLTPDLLSLTHEDLERLDSDDHLRADRERMGPIRFTESTVPPRRKSMTLASSLKRIVT